VDTLIILEAALAEAREETRLAAWTRTQDVLAAARAVPDGGAALRAALAALDQTDAGPTTSSAPRLNQKEPPMPTTTAIEAARPVRITRAVFDRHIWQPTEQGYRESVGNRSYGGLFTFLQTHKKSRRELSPSGDSGSRFLLS